MLLLLKSEEAKSGSAAARQPGAHRNTMADWLGCDEDGGSDTLCQIGEPGPDPGQQSIPGDVMEKPKQRPAEPKGLGSYKEIQQWLAEEQGADPRRTRSTTTGRSSAIATGSTVTTTGRRTTTWRSRGGRRWTWRTSFTACTWTWAGTQ